MLFGTAAWYAWFEWRRTGKPSLAAFSGAMAGCAMGCKYTAFLLLPAFAVAWWLSPESPRRKRAAIIWVAAAAFFVVPWLARNWLIRGNPVHPFLSAWMGMPAPRLPDMALPFEEAGTEGRVLASTVGGKLDSLLLGDGRFTGPIAPVFAAFLPLLLFFGPKVRSPRESARYATLVFVASWFLLCPDPRFLAPVLPLAFILMFASLDAETPTPALRRSAHWILQAGLVAGALFGAGYQWTTFAPFAMPLGLESRQDKLELGLRPAPFLAYAMKATEERVPREGRVLAVCAVHSYYLERETLTDVHYGRAHVTSVVRYGRDEEGIARRLRQLGVKWILAAEDLAGNFLPVHGFYDAPKAQWDEWLRFLARRTEPVWQTDGFVLYRIGAPHPPRNLPSAPPVDAMALEDTTMTMQDGKPTLTLRILDIIPPGLEGVATPKLVRARAYSALRDFTKALASYDAAIRCGLDTPETDLGRARALYALGQPAESARAAMRALERNPRSAYANGLLAIMLADRGAYAQARELAQRAALLDPDEPQYKSMLRDIRAKDVR